MSGGPKCPASNVQGPQCLGTPMSGGPKCPEAPNVWAPQYPEAPNVRRPQGLVSTFRANGSELSGSSKDSQEDLVVVTMMALV